jgi:hypothetical protein
MMHKIQSSLLLLFYFSPYFININCTSYPLLNKPDIIEFKNLAINSALIDSLAQGKISAGMPYYIIEEIFKNWPDNLKKTKIPVASLGSKQHLIEIEGWGRAYVDPDIKIFMDEYETERGKLNIWYQFPDFYRMDISSGDTLIIFMQDTVLSSVISDLKKARVISVTDVFKNLPRNKNLFGEIRYQEHPWRKTSYWYNLRVLSDGKTFLLKDLNYETYPIELLEFNDEPTTSFNWR